MMPISTGDNSAGKLPFFFIISGVICLLLSSLFLLSVVPELAVTYYRTPSMLAWAHLFILGFATMTAMGAMYQLMPVAIQVQIYSIKLGYWQFVVYLLGVIGLTLGFLTLQLNLLAISGVLTFLGFIGFIYNMLCTIQKLNEATDISRHILSSLIYLLLTVILGLLFALNMKWGFLGSLQGRLYYIHFIFGFVGWFTLLIFGFSYKMVPMFALSHGYSEKLPGKILITTHCSILVLIVGVLAANRFIISLGILALLLTYWLFFSHVQDILQKRLKRNLDVGLKAAIVSIGSGPISLILLFLLITFYPSQSWLLSALLLYLLGWIGLSINGYLFKIIPFLWWTHKYGSRIGKENVPQLKDLINEKAGRNVFWGMIGGTLLLCLSVGFQYLLTMWIAAVILTVSIILSTINNLVVFRK